MELELILTELQPFELSHFRQGFVCRWIIICFYFETMQTCCGYIEDAHVNFCGPKKFLSNLRTFDLDNLEVSFQHRVASLCNQLLPGVSSSQFAY